MKTYFKLILQRLLGFNNYLYCFSIFKITFLKFDKYETPLFSILNKVKNKGLILDVGANIGIISVHLAKNFSESKVIGFEPVPFNQKTFLRVCKHYNLKNIELETYALGDKNEKNTIYVPVKNSVKMQGLASITNEKNQNSIAFDIEVKRLDDIEKYKNQSISLIKIDVENYEYQVLLGALNTITKNLPILYVELWDNENRTNCIAFLSKIGYEAYYFDNKKWHIYSNTSKKPQKSQNFLFLHPSKNH